VAPFGKSRSRWTWHPTAQREALDLQQRNPSDYGVLTAKLKILTKDKSGRLAQPGVGRVQQTPLVTDSTRWGVVLFVERQDGHGLGGLLLHECVGDAGCPPPEAYELAQHRLSEMTTW
jgi:hypothetical protein